MSDHKHHDHAGHDHAAQAHHKPAAPLPDFMNPAPRPGMATDPVCGMQVKMEGAQHTATFAGETYYFCCDGCATKFKADPQAYADKGEKKPLAEAKPAPKGPVYTCPMHPQIQQEGPGSCPICGMALEPMMPSLDDGPNHELIDMTRRFWVATALAVPVFVLAMGADLFGWFGFIPAQTRNVIQLVLATPAVLWAGWPFFARGWASVLTRNLNMFTLIALGVGVAWAYSVVATLLPGIFPMELMVMHGAPAVYFEAAAVITALALLGQVLELRARENTSGAIRALLGLVPKTARRVTADGRDEDVPVEHLAAGDRLRLRPGEKVPVDGVLREGRTHADESMVTGESLPVSKEAGDRLIAGTVNQSGTVLMEATGVGRDTMLSRIVEMVAAAQRSAAPIQRLADQVSGWFVPLVIGIAMLSFIAWMAFGPEPRLPFALVAAVSVLIIACPCALGLATPMSIMVGVGKGATHGLLVRDAAVLERLEKVDTLVVDKTGTLTEGKPQVTRIVAEGFAEAELLRLAASLERGSEHPIASAIVARANADGLALADPTDTQTQFGAGIAGTVEGKRLVIGSEAYVGATGANASPWTERLAGLRAEGATAVLVAVDGVAVGAIAVADPIRQSTRPTLDALRAEGIRVVMMTGDNETTARAVARELGIDEVEAGVLPDRKAAVVEKLRQAGRIVAMAGDGVNDAPALAAADVGIAMGTGTDIAMESAGVTLLNGDLGGIVRARKLSAATMRNIRQNLAFAFVYNAAGVPIAAGLLFPVFGWLLSPAIAAAAMALSSVSVIANALRLNSTRID